MKPISTAPSMAVLTLLLAVGTESAPAEAQGFWESPGYSSYYRPRTPLYGARPLRRDATRALPRAPKATPEEKAALATPSSGPLMAVVSLSNQRMTVYDSSGPILHSPVSSGTTGHRTPTGVFSILQKNRHHVSNIYSGAPMPYMQRLTWSGIALHAGVLPGYPASHGCIRLPYPVAAKLFAMSKMGMRVVVAPSETSAVSFSHPALPAPLMVAAPANDGMRTGANTDASVIRIAAEGPAADAAAASTRYLNPMQAAQMERNQSRQRIADAIRANKQLLEDSQRASAEANAAAGAARVAQAQVDALRMRLDRAAPDAREEIERQIPDAERAVSAARANEAERSKAAFAAAVASRDAEEAQAAVEEAAKVAERGTEPIAVFISRKEGKVMVRQGMVPLFEAPVTFKEPNRPLGTHVFQAMAGDNATGNLTWQSVTVPESISFGENIDNRGPVRRGERAQPVNVGSPSDARGALERVEMDADVRKRISQRLWTNGSITISDHGISNETGKYTDFVVLTR